MAAADLPTYEIWAHEAGHAVAAVLRGHELVGIGVGGGEGMIAHTEWGPRHPMHVPFFSFSGPWAQARASWDPDGDWDLEDEFAGAWLNNWADRQILRAARAAVGAGGDFGARALPLRR